MTTFAVRKRALVRISVRELEPVCRTVGKYRFAAQPGRNRLRLPKQIGKTRLGIGTYALVGETLLGRRIFAVVATVHRSKGRLLARVRHTSAGCTAHTFAVAGASLTMPGAVSEQTADTSARRSSAPRSVFKPPAVETRHPHTSPFVRAATLNDAPMALRPLLYGLLAISIGLLAAAAMPNTVLPAGAAAAFVTSKRAYLAAAGIWLLVVVAVIAAAA